MADPRSPYTGQPVRTDLTAANLANANLSAANLTRATYDGKTKWPAGFTPPRDATMGKERQVIL